CFIRSSKRFVPGTSCFVRRYGHRSRSLSSLMLRTSRFERRAPGGESDCSAEIACSKEREQSSRHVSVRAKADRHKLTCLPASRTPVPQSSPMTLRFCQGIVSFRRRWNNSFHLWLTSNRQSRRCAATAVGAVAAVRNFRRKEL